MVRLKIVLAERNWKVPRLAAESGVNQVTIYEILNGRRRPYDGQAAKIALALGIPEVRASELFEEVEDDRP